MCERPTLVAPEWGAPQLLKMGGTGMGCELHTLYIKSCYWRCVLRASVTVLVCVNSPVKCV